MMHIPFPRRRRVPRIPPADPAPVAAVPPIPARRTPSGWTLNNSAPPWGNRAVPVGTVGYRHLYWLLSMHAILSSEGVAAAWGLLTTAQIAKASTACGYFDLPDLAAAMADVPHAASSPTLATVFDAMYHHRYATTDTVAAAIRAKIAALPHEFPHDNA